MIIDMKKLFKNWYWKGWYFLIEAPKMKASGGAVWPIVRVQDITDEKTIKHEEAHLKTELSLLMVIWGILYLIFWATYGYAKNPFERYADDQEEGAEWVFFGWMNYF
jgi:hypothetical protein